MVLGGSSLALLSVIVIVWQGWIVIVWQGWIVIVWQGCDVCEQCLPHVGVGRERVQGNDLRGWNMKC